MSWSVEQANALQWLRAMPADSADLLVTSPPYAKARLYLEGGEDMGIARDTEAWVAWLIEIWTEAQRVVTGAVVMVVEGQTRNYRYSAGPLLLAADLHRRGFNLRKPPIFYRVGIPGSGGPDWWRNDYEFCLVTTRPGQLPYSDNTATGHPPKWAPGGEMSHRLGDGRRRNQWGGADKSGGHSSKDGSKKAFVRPSHVLTSNREVNGVAEDSEQLLFEMETAAKPHKMLSMSSRGTDGKRKISGGRRVTRGKIKGDTATEDAYDPPVLANPGNVIQQRYSAQEVAAILRDGGDVHHCKVGGGVMGNRLAHVNEAPFPEAIVEPFVLSFCPPGGTVLDCFTGSGTTGAVSVRHGRNFRGCDLRASQVELARKRIGTETPLALFEGDAS